MYRALVAMLLFGAVGGVHGAELPAGLSFVGHTATGWEIFVVNDEGRLRRVPAHSEPRTPAYSLSRRRLAYVSAEGHVREIDLRSGDDRVVVEAGPGAAYTQPAYQPGGARLYLVRLKQGSSVDTDLVAVDPDRANVRVVTGQRSAQFEPRVSADGRFLYYSSVACTLSCGKIIQEIWRRDLLSGESEQVTLLNGIARQPFPGSDGSLYFVSNRAGSFHLWRWSIGDIPERLTSGIVSDESPVLASDQSLYFIRRSPTGTRLMRLAGGGTAEPVSLSVELADLKDLRAGN